MSQPAPLNPPSPPAKPGDADAQGGEALPKRFGKYTLIRRFATGGMAELFLGRESQNDFRFVEVKDLSTLAAEEQPEKDGEGVRAKRLTHPEGAPEACRERFSGAEPCPISSQPRTTDHRAARDAWT